MRSKGSRQIVRIAGRIIGDPTLPPAVVAEIGINHNGDVETAMALIREAAQMGCWAVKLQTRTVDVVYTAKELAASRKIADTDVLRRAVRRGALSSEARARLEASNFEDTTNGDLKYALEFTDQELADLVACAARYGVVFFSSPWDEASVDRLETVGVPCYKVASACVTDHGLLQRIKATGKPVILSTGMSTLDQVQAAIDQLDRSKLVLMHTTSVYPCQPSLLNLDVIDTLKWEAFPDLLVGYSGHEGGIALSLMAAARFDLPLIERHVTLDRKMFGSDQAASLEMSEMAELIRGLREFHEARGSGEKRILDEEVPVLKKLRRFP